MANQNNQNGTMDDITSGVKEIVSGLSEALRSVTEAVNAKKKEVDHGNVVTHSTTQRKTESGDYKNAKYKAPKLYKKVDGSDDDSKWGLIGGGALMGGGAITTAVTVANYEGNFFPIFLGVFLAILGGSIGVNALKKRKLEKRFKEYLAILGNKTYVTVGELVQKTGRSEEKVEAELQELIEKKYFLQGHLDRENDYFITADETFRNYEQVLVLQEKQRALRAEEDEIMRDSGLSTEGIRLIRKGQEYIATINRLNAEIPDPVMTEKLQTLENLIRRILEEVRKAPESASEIRKLMNYYLPTTEKLVRSYYELDQRPESDDNVRTKAEISLTLDTMNIAIEKMLDKWERHENWDLSSEINVLNHILEMDGLKEQKTKLEFGGKK